jgi:predicted DNA-binding ribbon-helix-helix protein
MPRHFTRSTGDYLPQPPDELRSTLINRNVTVGNHRTSIRLEPAMWEALHQVCRREGKTLHELVTGIERERAQSSLTAAIRVYVMTYYMDAATDEGHRRAGHGVPRQFTA